MDNKIDVMLTRAIRILLIAIICIMLIIGTIFIVPPSYAVGVDDYQITYKSNSLSYQEYQENYTFIQIVNSRYLAIKTRYDYSSTPYYMFIYGVTTGQSVGNMHFVYLFKSTDYDNLTNYDIEIQYPGGSTGFGAKTKSLNEYSKIIDDTYCYSDNTFTSYSANIVDFYCPHFSTLQEGLEAFESYISGGSALSYNSTITIEPGYVAYCLCEGGSVVLNTIMPLNSNLNIAGKPKWDSLARIAFGVQRPISGTTITNTFGDLINWQKNGTAPSNILGMTKYAQAIYNDLPSDGSFVAIYNPAYYGDDMSNPTQAPSITATFTNLGAVAKYPMNTHVAYTPLSGWNVQSGSDSDWEEYGIAVPTTDGAITTTDYIMSTTSQPAIEFQDGGYNDSSSVNNDAGSVLQRIIQPIINLLKAPIEHINSLIAQGSAFMRSISQLFTWLPSPVLTVLIDALIVCIVIGAIKLLF